MELTDYKNKHLGQDIYVLGSGKSIDFIDNSFFKDKIIIGINQVYKKTVCQYLVRKEYDIIKEVLADKRTNNSIIFVPIYKKEQYKTVLNGVKNLPNNILYFESCKYPIWNTKNALPDNDSLIVSPSTITSGIHLAAYMGAKNIIILGHDCGTLNGEVNFKNYHTSKTYKIAHTGKNKYQQWVLGIENDTIKLKKLLKKKYKCNIYSLNPFINFGLEGNKYVSNKKNS